MKVAVVRNRENKGVIGRLGQPSPETYGRGPVQAVIDALREGGHTVAVFEGDMTLPANLQQFMPADPDSGLPTGMVFNMAYGIQGQCRYTHVPAMLEMAGVPYTGSSPFGHALSHDKVVSKILMREAGVPTPDFHVAADPGHDPVGLRFPLIVKPRHESTSYGLYLVRSRDELNSAVCFVLAEYKQEALVEEYIDGREICVGLLGNEPVEYLPLVGLDFGGRETHVLTWEDKYHKRPDEPKKICPVHLPDHLAANLREIALAAFRACHCKDYARVDIRIDSQGNPQVLEINSMASLVSRASYVLAALHAGYSFTALACRILDIAHERYFGVPAPRDASAKNQTANDASETGRTTAEGRGDPAPENQLSAVVGVREQP